MAALLAGNFELGFEKYEWRKRHDRFRPDFVDPPGPQWDGSDPAGLTILVHAEQGLGDTIQFARYLPMIAARSGRPVLACEPALVPLLRGMDGVGVVAKGAPLPRYDRWIDQMSLPRVFATRVDSILSADGYLRADPARIARWRDALPAGPRVGITWAGNPAHSTTGGVRFRTGNSGESSACPASSSSTSRSAPGQTRARLRIFRHR